MIRLIIVALLLTLYIDAKCDRNAKILISTYSKVKACKNNYIIFSDGTKMVYDDGKKKSFEQRLKNADIQDMFYDKYPIGSCKTPRFNHDPGRYRNDRFFRKIYGSSASSVRKNLVRVRWLPKSLKRTVYIKVHKNIASKMRAVSNELDRLPQKYKKYLYPMGGTFNWRNIAGTHRLSSHSFGTAIDINVKYSAYWRWSKGKYRYQNKIPCKIVNIFEKYGFIWGGKWYHYDTMHFEYRPEIIKASR